MKKQIINDIEQKMRSVLNKEQRKRLEEVLEYAYYGIEIIKTDNDEKNQTDYSDIFVSAKRVEGCSERTIQYYKLTVEHMLSWVSANVRKITTEEIR